MISRRFLLLAAVLAHGHLVSAADRDASQSNPAVASTATSASADHPIDDLLVPYFQAHHIDPPDVIADQRFVRRAYLDVVGMLPSFDQVSAFCDSQDPRRHEKLVDQLLDDRVRYAEHWMTFWNDCLRNDYRGTGYIDGGRKQITAWLYRSLSENLPYDEFVRQLIAPSPESEGFIKGIVWRGVVNASQQPPVQAAQHVSQVFLGINLKCASCHDSFINDWKLDDAYGLAGVFSADPLEIHHCNQPTGQTSEVKFLFPELGSIDAAADVKTRQRQLAQLITSSENRRFARTIVNRYWAQLFGRGIVEPVDDLDAEPFDEDLLQWLADDFVEHDYDLQYLLRLLLTSTAYRLPAVDPGGPEAAEFVFRGPVVRRLSAEQYVDAVSQVTGIWKNHPETLVTTMARLDDHATPAAHDHQGQRLESSGPISQGSRRIDVDITGVRKLWLVVTDAGDGRHHDWANWGEPTIHGPAGSRRLTDLDWLSAKSGHKTVQQDKNAVGNPLSIAGERPKFGLGTHADSAIVYAVPAGFTRFTAIVGPDDEAVAAGKDRGHTVEFHVLGDLAIRAVTTTSDTLTRALGRPNREQVVTRRESAATTLQALELTNGETLADRLSAGAARRIAAQTGAQSAEDLVASLFRDGLGRSPTTEETQTALDLVGSPPTQSGLEDLLWIVVQHPEFQLIY